MKIGGAVVVSNGDLFDFPKISYKNGNHLNELKYIVIEHTIEVLVFTVNEKLSSYILIVWFCKIPNQISLSKIL